MTLSDSQVIPTVAVSDIGRARELRGGAGPLRERRRLTAVSGIRAGVPRSISIHRPKTPASLRRTDLYGLQVDDIERAVDELIAAGITFEQYDMDPIKTDEKGIAHLGDSAGAWFKDPDGNIFALDQE